jgi:hypothetical protein
MVFHFYMGGENIATLPDGRLVPIVPPGDAGTMMMVYGIGFIAVFFCYVLLYWNVRRNQEELRLNRLELFVTSQKLREYQLCILVGLVSLGIAIFGGDGAPAWSGYSYVLLGPVLGLHGFLGSRTWKKIDREMQQQFQQRPPDQGRQFQQRQQQGHQQQGQQGQRPQGPRHQGQQRRHGPPRPQRPQRPPDQSGPPQQREP